MEDFLYEFAKVRKVINSCRTEEQYQNAYRWARDWSKRMSHQYSDIVPDWESLLDQVISE
jgi:hypothetical protein